VADAAGWSDLHHGIDPRRVPLLAPWLRTMWWLARPFAAARVPPLALTAAGAVVALDAALLARRYPLAALVCVLLAVVCDGLDGAVALAGRRVTVVGGYADRVSDRIADLAFAAVLWRCGAPWPLALAAGLLSLAHEGIRAAAGGARLGRITVAERPTRTICAVLACASSAVTDQNWPVTVCAAVWTGLAVLGLAQLVRA
jgi:CDP-diacylglycerol--glycerol-3-phosphate 3-phosphatidyltransferase